MRRFGLGSLFAAVILFHGGAARAQDSLQALQEELKEAKDAHTQMTEQTLSNFFAQVDPAMASPDAAATLYEQAGGAAPDPSPVLNSNPEEETATEKETRLALDQANLTRLGTAVELHCGLLHFGALFVVKPDQPGLQDAWVAWLKTAAQTYPQLAVPAGATQQPQPEHKHHHKDQDANNDAPPTPKPQPPTYYPYEMMAKPLKDSIISKYLVFGAWADKDQGAWNVHAIPQLYKDNVLTPSRTKPTEATLANWDVFIAMANADERDNDRWNTVVLPPLRFDRACDEYAVSPSTEKLEGLVNLIKASPTNPHADEWITRVSGLMDDYRVKHGGAPLTPSGAAGTTNTATTNTAPGTSAVTVTTEQQGDATIITTHASTNAAPVGPH
jgi:hypothetical protein